MEKFQFLLLCDEFFILYIKQICAMVQQNGLISLNKLLKLKNLKITRQLH